MIIAMRISTFFYTIKQGLKNIWKNKMFSLASIATMTACIFLFGLFYTIVTNFQSMVKDAESGVAVTVFFDEGISQDKIDEIGDLIRARAEVSDLDQQIEEAERKAAEEELKRQQEEAARQAAEAARQQAASNRNNSSSSSSNSSSNSNKGNSSNKGTSNNAPSYVSGDAVSRAKSALGKPYVWGATGPNSFDCSGFVCWVYTHSGVHNLPRTTAQGIYNQCTRVSASEAKPGDLVFFQGTYNAGETVTHIGIYVGQNRMLHCGSPIQYTSIDTSYWRSHFYSYGRL